MKEKEEVEKYQELYDYIGELILTNNDIHEG